MKLANSIAGYLVKKSTADLPGLDEMLPRNALEDDDAFEHTLEVLETTPAKILEIDGPGALPFVIDLYRDIIHRIERWEGDPFALASTESSVPENSEKEPGESMLVSSLSVVVALAVFAIAHWLVGLTLAASAGMGAGLGAIALLAFLIVLWASNTDVSDSESRDEEDSTREDRLAVIGQNARGMHTRLISVRDSLADVSNAIPLAALSAWFPERLPVDDEGLTTDHSQATTAFCRPLDNPRLVDAMYERHNPHGDPVRATRDFIETVAPWEKLLSLDARLTTEEVCRFCQTAFETIFEERIFSDSSCREAIAEDVELFLETWRSSPPKFLEHHALAQHDTDGFRHPIDRAVYVAPDLESTVETLLPSDREIEIRCTQDKLADIFIIDATTDISVDAIAILNSTTR